MPSEPLPFDIEARPGRTEGALVNFRAVKNGHVVASERYHLGNGQQRRALANKLAGHPELRNGGPLDAADIEAELLAREDDAQRDFDERLTLAAETVQVDAGGEDAPGTNDKPRRSHADILVELCATAELFHAGDNAFANVPVGDHRETWPVRTNGFKYWLARQFYEQIGRTPSAQAMQDAICFLTGKAVFQGTENSTAVRIAGDDTNIYIDLCNPEWEVIHVDRDSWRVVPGHSVPVKFIRRSGMGALPTPVPGGTVDSLREHINLPEGDGDSAWALVVGWLVMAFRPSGPYPVLSVDGPHGCAKSSLCRFLREIIDPNVAPLRRPPRDERDLMIAATNAWVVGFDNLSSLRGDLSDALCCLATGAGFGTRKLYADDEEKIFSAARPILLNGINSVTTRSDLADRAVHITLGVVSEDRRLDERELRPAFDRDKPYILGAILDAVSCAIRNIDTVKLDSKPRMADFATWVTAASESFGWEVDHFLDAYAANRSDASASIIEANIVGQAVVGLMSSRTRWSGTARELLAELEDHHTDERTKRDKLWPKNAAGLGRALRRLVPDLQSQGISFDSYRDTSRQRVRIIVLEKRCNLLSEPSEPSATAPTGPETLFPEDSADSADGSDSKTPTQSGGGGGYPAPDDSNDTDAAFEAWEKRGRTGVWPAEQVE